VAYPRGALVALLKQESQLGLNQVQHDPRSHAAGVAQIQPGTAAGLAKEGMPSDRFSGRQSIDMAARLLDKAMAGNGGDWDNAAQQYWAGSQKGINAHPDGATGYVKAVDKNLSVDDLIAQGTDFTGRNGHASPLVASGAAPAPSAPAASATPDQSPDFEALVKQGTDFSGGQGQTLDGTGAGGAVTPSSTNQRQAAAAMLGIIRDKTLDPQDALQKATAAAAQYGVVPNSEDLRAAISAHNAAFTGEPAKPMAPDPAIDRNSELYKLDSLGAGAKHGVEGTFQGLNNIAARADAAAPFLNKIDQAIGMNSAQVAAKGQVAYDNQGAYDQTNWAGPQYGAGNFVGSVVSQAPLLAAGGEMLGATVRGGASALGAGSAEPAVNFLTGKAGLAVRNPAGVVTQAGSLPLRVASLSAQGAGIGAPSAV
jgi:hypothetical protein